LSSGTLCVRFGWGQQLGRALLARCGSPTVGHPTSWIIPYPAVPRHWLLAGRCGRRARARGRAQRRCRRPPLSGGASAASTAASSPSPPPGTAAAAASTAPAYLGLARGITICICPGRALMCGSSKQVSQGTHVGLYGRPLALLARGCRPTIRDPASLLRLLQLTRKLVDMVANRPLNWSPCAAVCINQVHLGDYVRVKADAGTWLLRGPLRRFHAPARANGWVPEHDQ
jgi:hypothetical protein